MDIVEFMKWLKSREVAQVSLMISAVVVSKCSTT